MNNLLSCCLLLSVALAGCSKEATPPAEVPQAKGDSRKASETPAPKFGTLTLDDFEAFPKTETPVWTTNENIITALPARGYLYSKTAYKNFRLEMEFRFSSAATELATVEKPANTGILVFIQEPHRVWPSCLEVQGRVDQIGHIKSNSRDVKVSSTDDPAAREKALKPIPEWNTLEVVSKEGALTSYLNGEKISESQPTSLTEGPIGIQAEGFPYELRKLEIQPLENSKEE